MKLRMLVIALAGALGAGCASTDKGPRAYQVEPVSNVSHGGVSSAQSYYQLGRYYHGQKRYDQAETAYRKSIALDAGQAAANNALGSLYAERGDLERSVQHFEKALAAAPEAGYLHNNLGFAYYLQGRMNEAYEAVRKALALDATLERGWANLQRIADHRSETQIAAAPKSGHPEASSSTPSANPAPAEVIAPAVATAPAIDRKGEPPLASPPSRIAIFDASSASATAPRSELAAPVTADSTTQEVSLQPADADGRSDDGRFVLVSTNREVVNLAQPLVLAKAEPAAQLPESPSAPATLPAHNADINVSRISIEVSNGNGVGGFARKFSLQLREDGIPVRRITNHVSFQLKETIIEYQPGYQDAANALMRRIQLDARAMPAPGPRAGTNVRIVLGRDVVTATKAIIAKAP